MENLVKLFATYGETVHDYLKYVINDMRKCWLHWSSVFFFF